MRRSVRVFLVGAAVAAASVAGAGGATAAHCTDEAGTTPGFSYFGNTHVADGEAHDAEGGNPGPHAGTSGASNCRETSGSPSDRAPGREE